MASIEVQRMSMDSSLMVKFLDDNFKVVIDPWLLGPEIDGSSIFNCAYHLHEPMNMEKVGNVDAIVISLPFNDHCHEDSLVLFKASVPIYGVIAVLRRLAKDVRLSDRIFIEITSDTEGTLIQSNLRIRSLPSPNIFDFVHSGLIFKDDNRNLVLYAPHGLYIENYQSNIVEAITSNAFLLILISCSKYCLPFYLGGNVNLGLDHAIKVAKVVQAKYLIDVHSEEKISTGIVPYVSFGKHYPSYDDIVKSINSSVHETQVINLNNYEPIIL